MSNLARTTALRGLRTKAPFTVHTSGREVVVSSDEKVVDEKKGVLQARVTRIETSSSGLARNIANRLPRVMATWGYGPHEALHVAKVYAEAEWAWKKRPKRMRKVA
jgi:hypothetical protein